MFNLQWNADYHQHPGDITDMLNALQQIHDLMDSDLAVPLALHQTLKPLESAWQAAWERLGRTPPVALNANMLWTYSQDDSFRAQFVDTAHGIQEAITEIFPGKTTLEEITFTLPNMTSRLTWGTTDICSAPFTVVERQAYLNMRFRMIYQHDNLDTLTRLGWYYAMDGACPGILESGHVGTLATMPNPSALFWFEKRSTPAALQFEGHEFCWLHPTPLDPGAHTVTFGYIVSVGSVVLTESDAIILQPAFAAQYPAERLGGEWELIYL